MRAMKPLWCLTTTLKANLLAYTPLMFCMLISITVHSQDTPVDTKLPATELLRRVIDGELKAHASDHSRWRYQLKAIEQGKEEVKLVVETREGDLDRLRSVNGQPITAEQEKQEDQRIQSLLQKAGERKKRQHAQTEDDRKTESLFKMFPDAVLARYGEHNGELVEILFEPNPNFHPSCNESLVFQEMEGRVWINEKQNRLAEIEGHLIRDVKFYGGLLGRLARGGEFHVQQAEVAPGHWEVTLLHVNMRGKALFFKTISVQQNKLRTNFERVPDNLSLAEAAAELQRLSTAKSAGKWRPRVCHSGS